MKFKKFKQWFLTPDEEGLSPFDALCALILNFGAWIILILLGCKK